MPSFYVEAAERHRFIAVPVMPDALQYAEGAGMFGEIAIYLGVEKRVFGGALLIVAKLSAATMKSASISRRALADAAAVTKLPLFH
jgi:hypothetical protein